MLSADRRILVIETSSRYGAAALADEGGVIASARLPGEIRHAGELLPAVDGMLTRQAWPADSLTEVYVSVGPGSFTGLRVGVTVARTLAWSVGTRVVAVPTADALALNGLAADPVPAHLAVLLDAKQSRVFAAAYEIGEGCCRTLIGAHQSDAGVFFSRCPRPLAVLGEGIPYHRSAVDAAGVTVLSEDLWRPRIENVYRLGRQLAEQGEFTIAGDLLPLYIRRPEAEEKWEKLYGPTGRRRR